jgi:hypothetical protein
MIFGGVWLLKTFLAMGRKQINFFTVERAKKKSSSQKIGCSTETVGPISPIARKVFNNLCKKCTSIQGLKRSQTRRMLKIS